MKKLKNTIPMNKYTLRTPTAKIYLYLDKENDKFYLEVLFLLEKDNEAIDIFIKLKSFKDKILVKQMSAYTYNTFFKIFKLIFNEDSRLSFKTNGEEINLIFDEDEI